MREHHTGPLESALERLATTPAGLGTAEAARRRGQAGPNRLEARRRAPEFIKFLRQFKNFFALLLIVGGALAMTAEELDPDQGNLYIAIALLAVVVLNAGPFQSPMASTTPPRPPPSLAMSFLWIAHSDVWM